MSVQNTSGGAPPAYSEPDYSAPPAGGAPPTTSTTGFAVSNFESKLAKVDKFMVKQGRWLLEMATCGIIPNSYLISDLDNMFVPDQDPKKEQQPYPLFTLQEQGGACCSKDCCCRCWCNPWHPSLIKFYNASEPQWQEAVNCCVCEIPGYTYANAMKEEGAFLSMERLGCCMRLPNCCVCTECCQDEVRIHRGDVGIDGSSVGTLGEDSVVFTGKVPLGGGACTPTVELFEGFHTGVGNEGMIGVVEGPTFFGGCYDLFSDTHWTVSTQPGGSGDIAKIRKLKPQGCKEWCIQFCSTADNYEIIMAPGANLTPSQKGLVLAEVMHLDYMFFESNQELCYIEATKDYVYISVLMCLCYCYGCLCPVKACVYIPTRQN